MLYTCIPIDLSPSKVIVFDVFTFLLVNIPFPVWPFIVVMLPPFAVISDPSEKNPTPLLFKVIVEPLSIIDPTLVTAPKVFDILE